MLGLGNAATPFGLRAMHALQTMNPDKTSATDAMCMFLAINTSSIQLIPVTAIAFLAAGGAQQPTAIVVSGLLATIASTFIAVVSARWFAKWRWFQKPTTAGV
jgi:spore maturation protein A